MRILLVEDDPMTARVTTRLLRQNGYWVTTAPTIAEALKAKLHEYQVVVSDIGLPDGSGFDLMRKIKVRCDLPGIALTGFGMDADIEKSRAAGFLVHLTKPVDFTKLEEALQRVGAATVT